MEEIWKGIKEFGYSEDTGFSAFEVSNLGCVRRAAYRDADGYHKPEFSTIIIDKYRNVKKVILRYGYKCSNLLVHILVAKYFVPNPTGLKYVKWLDGDSLNCKADNLYWTNEKTMRHPAGGNRGKPLRVYSDKHKLLGEFGSCKGAAIALNVPSSAISKCCLRGSPMYLGLIWRYVEDDEFYVEGAKPECDLVQLRELCATRQSGLPRGSVRQYSVDGELIDTHSSIEKIGGRLGTGRRNIARCCQRINSSAYGYVWRYAYDDELFELSAAERAKCISLHFAGNNHNVVHQYSFEGLLVDTHDSLKAAVEKTGISKNSISLVCKRYMNTRTAGGFVWRYELDDELYGLTVDKRREVIKELLTKRQKGVKQYSEDGKFIAEFGSPFEAAKATGCPRTRITNCCNNRQGNQSFGGFVWKWAEESTEK